MKALQKVASVHANVNNHFNLERHLVDRQTYKERRSAVLADWKSLAGYAPDDHRYHRIGFRLDPDPNAAVGTPFSEEVVADCGERWFDELQVFHNPRAKFRLPLEAFAGATQHTFEDSQLISFSVGTPVLSSGTIIMRLVGDEEFKEATV